MAALALCLAACTYSTSSGEEIDGAFGDAVDGSGGGTETNGLKTDIVAVVYADRTFVRADTGTGGFDQMTLTGGDRFVAVAADQRVRLDYDSFLGDVEYHGDLVGVSEPGQVVTVTLLRDGERSASSVTLPRAPRVVSPAPQARVSRSRDVLVEVDMPGRYRLLLDGGCLDPFRSSSTIYPAEGAPLIIGARTIKALRGRRGETCLVTLTVTRIVPGELAASFDGGSITAESSTSVVVQSTP